MPEFLYDCDPCVVLLYDESVLVDCVLELVMDRFDDVSELVRFYDVRNSLEYEVALQVDPRDRRVVSSSSVRDVDSH